MSTTAAVPAAIDRGYWLARCEGYQVRMGRRNVGVVEEVDSVDGRAAALVVRGGILETRRLVVLTDDVEAVIPRDERVELRATARLNGGSSRGRVRPYGGASVFVRHLAAGE